MKPLRALLLGYGARGHIYADYMRRHPEQYTLSAIADINGSGDYLDWCEMIGYVEADVAIVALPDSEHFGAGLTCLAMGLHVLMEKPIACTWQECLIVRNLVKECNRMIMPCYPLRFHTSYRKVFDLLKKREIGDLISIRHLNQISYLKTMNNFCRGNWGNTEKSGPMILTKCCHDFDIIDLLAGADPVELKSIGGRMMFTAKNAPANAATTCEKCKLKDCPFRDKGACVFKTDSDVADHQSTIINYANGLSVSFDMEAISTARLRQTVIYGTEGVLKLDDTGDECKIDISYFDRQKHAQSFFDSIDLSKDRHGGGDDELMNVFYQRVTDRAKHDYVAEYDQSLRSHRLAFAAEHSRLRDETIRFKKGKFPCN